MKTLIQMKDIHFSIHSIITDDELIHEFFEWVNGISIKDKVPRTLDFVMSPVSKSDIPKELKWSDILDYINYIPCTKLFGETEIEIQEKRISRMSTAEFIFDKFLHQGLSKETEKRITEKWNKVFNSFKEVNYKNFEIFSEGMSSQKNGKNFSLLEQQKKGVAFLCTKGNGLLAYDVGVGKTYTGITAAVHQMHSGFCKRPLFIVPNAVYTKWISDFEQIFPEIKLNKLFNLGTKYINNLFIEENTASVCTTEALDNIYYKEESLFTWIADSFKYICNTKTIKNLFLPPEDLPKEEYIFFEDIQFDLIVVDEAHRYKNLIKKTCSNGRHSEFTNLGFGIPSNRALKMYAITEYIHKHNDDKNVFFLTATPFTNSPMEIYSMLLFVSGQRIKDIGFESINDFLDEFAEINIEWTVDSRGLLKRKTIMKSFRSLPALQLLIRNSIDKVSADDAHIKRPKKETYVEKLDMNDVQTSIYYKEISDIEKNGGNLYVLFRAINNMRMTMLSPALVKASDYNFPIPPLTQLVQSSPKLLVVCGILINVYKNKPNCGQIIYMPRGVKESRILKEYLVTNGIPEKAIGLINSSTSEKQKDKLTDKFNNPDDMLKIIIGSETISEGIDLNGNSLVLYNCMLGWNPTEPIQVEGRLWRQGNRQKKVHIVYPIMYNSIDSLIFQKHDEKTTRIDAIWNYRGDKINVEEIKPEQLKLDLIKDPYKKADALIENESIAIKRKLQIVQDKLELINSSTVRVIELDQHIKELKKKKKEIEEFVNGEQSKDRPEELFGMLNLMSNIASDEMNTINADINKQLKLYEQINNNIKNQVNSFLPEDPKERDTLINKLINDRTKFTAELDELTNKKTRIIVDLIAQNEEEQKNKKTESIESIITRLTKSICSD